jgi:hypothetical protein
VLQEICNKKPTEPLFRLSLNEGRREINSYDHLEWALKLVISIRKGPLAIFLDLWFETTIPENSKEKQNKKNKQIRIDDLSSGKKKDSKILHFS